MAPNWAATIAGEIGQLKASGFLRPAGLILGDLLDRYIHELYPLKRWSASKTRDTRLVKRKLGAAERKALNSTWAQSPALSFMRALLFLLALASVTAEARNPNGQAGASKSPRRFLQHHSSQHPIARR